MIQTDNEHFSEAWLKTDDVRIMKSHLIEIEQKALEARNAGRLEEAARFYEMIVTEMPDWEHGTAIYSLACCCEDLGKIASAEKYYREALQHEPENSIFIGGLASFLYLHGDPAESFQLHLALLRIERNEGNEARAQSTESPQGARKEDRAFRRRGGGEYLGPMTENYGHRARTRQISLNPLRKFVPARVPPLHYFVCGWNISRATQLCC